MKRQLQAIRDKVENARRELAELRRVRAHRTTEEFGKYRDDPVGYSVNVIRQQWWEKQCEMASGLVKPPYRVHGKASHGVGKSHVAGGLVNWWHDSFNPGVALTTAPTDRQVKDVLWKEVRRQRASRGGFPGPKIPRLETAPDHFAHGFTARDATSFQGQHEEHVLIVFDEAVGVGREFWEAAETMLQGERCAFLAIYNPTDTTSFAYAEEQDALETGRAKIVEIPATLHPNIVAELQGKPPPYPKAIRLAWLEDRIRKWCERIDAADATATDLNWRPGSDVWYRPGPLAQARLLSQWPSSSSGVWGDALWRSAESSILPMGHADLPEIGCDVARYGDDNTEIHVRCGPVSLHHESHNGWGTDQTAGRLKQLAREWSAWATEQRDKNSEAVKPVSLRIKVDDDGVGGGVWDQLREFNAIRVRSQSEALDPEDYRNIRSELWFTVADRAKQRRLSLVRLPAEIRRELKRQAMAPKWKVNGAGQREVEPKDDTKESIGRSPDGMDAVNLAYYEGGQAAKVEGVESQDRAGDGRGFDRMAQRQRG